MKNTCKIYNGKKKIFSILIALFSILAIGQAQAQTKVVTGTVTDASGEAIIGASIKLKNGYAGTITDAEGKFSLDVHDQNVLTISYIGYVTQEINITGKRSVEIVMQENTELLDEVVVIGYGTVKRKDFTGSVSSVKLENSPVALAPNLNALESLKGNVSGLNIGASNKAGEGPDMLIRGQNSINGSNSPLVVLDGVVYLGSIRDINPNDIATIDVLKDATSAAVYGSRASNGVIAITTKKGSSDKPVITFNANLAAQNWQYKPDVMNPDQWFASVNARNGYQEGSTNWLKRGEIMNRDKGLSTNWLDESTRTGVVQDYQVAISGAAPKVNYYLSTSYSENAGIVKGNNFDRVSLLGKIKTDVTSWLEAGIDASFAKVDYSGFEANLLEALKMSPYGVYYRDEENKLLEKYPTVQSAVHPLWGVDDDVRTNSDIRNNYRLGTNVLVKVPWIKGLTYRFNYMSNWELSTKKNFYTERNYVKEGEYDDPSRYTPAAYESLLSSANGSVENYTVSSYVMDNIINYSNSFNKHGVDLTLVATRDLRESEKITSAGKDFAANGNTSLGVNGLNKATTQTVNQVNDRRANIGYLARLSYSYDDKYYATGSYRRDGASVFGTNSKWGNFAAFGLAWRISQENFLKELEQLNDLKLKVSWGQNGNQGIDPYGTLSTIINGQSGGVRYQFGNTKDKVYYGLYQNTMGNNNLGWESTAAYNFGLESTLFSGRLKLDVDFYTSKTTDQLFTRNIPVMTGFKTMKTSMGQVNNKGIEITLRTVNVETKDIRWSTAFTFWKNDNKLAKLYGDDLNGDGKEDDDIANSLFIGKSLGAIYGYKQIGIVQEEDAEYIKLTGAKAGAPKYEDIDGTPGISSTDRQILGYNKENFRLSMSNIFSYKDLELYVMLTGTFGGNDRYLKSNAGAYQTATGRFNDNGIYINHWTPENRSNIYPSITFSGDSRFLGLQSREFIRLQDVTLSYTFRQSWMKSALIRSLKVFCTGKNLLTLTDWEGGDPETGSGVWDNADGINFPVPTSLSFGVNVSF